MTGPGPAVSPADVGGRGWRRSLPSGHLRLDRVTRRFRTPEGRLRAALDDVSLVVRQGELLALLGPSGAGKSTLLNCVAGLVPLSSGSIWMNERRIDRLPPDRRGFGMVFQHQALFPHLTVRENVGFGLRVRGAPAREVATRAERALRLVQLEGYDDKRPDQLSGGEQQRVAVARAIVFEPPVVLLDEPLSSLDPRLRGELRALIRRVHREVGSTVVFVTHDQDEALALAERVAVFRAGVVVQSGSPRDVFAFPVDPETARFVGYRNVLEIEGDCDAGDDGVVVLRRGALAFAGTVPPASRDARGAWRAIGPRTCVAIHPEDIVIGSGAGTSPESADPRRGALRARVESVEAVGRASNVSVALGEGVSLVARTSRPVAVGDVVSVALPPERVLVYAMRPPSRPTELHGRAAVEPTT